MPIVRVVCQGSQQFLRTNFHDFSMIFHDFPWSFRVFFHDQCGKKMVSGITFYFSYCGLHIISFSHAFFTKNELSSLEYARAARFFFDNACAAQKSFPWFFHRGFLKFHDFSMIWTFFFKFHDFSRSGKCFFHFPGFPWFSMTLGTLVCGYLTLGKI